MVTGRFRVNIVSKCLAAILLLASASHLCAEETGLWESLGKLRHSAREKKVEAQKQNEAAHAALDRTEYEEAVRLHKGAKKLLDEAAAFETQFVKVVEKIVNNLRPELNSDDFAVRETATQKLIRLGPGAAKALKLAAEGKEKEVQVRLNNVASKLEEFEEDAHGRLHQWAESAKASSEYGATGWSASQATGKPNTLQAGDAQTAWASMAADGGEEWLELTFANWVEPTSVCIHENCAPGAVAKLEILDAEGKWHTLWKGKDPTTACPGVFQVPFDRPKFAARTIRIVLDTSLVAGWNEIDAVELIGEMPIDAPTAAAKIQK
jgi:hypothetical protein